MFRKVALSRLVLGLLAAPMAGACASTGAVPRPFPGAPTAGASGTEADLHPRADSSTTPVGDVAVVGAALALRGVPYREGGADPEGFDCSGFTQYVYAQFGVQLAREVREQFEQGTSVKSSEVLPGDLLFFTTVARGPTHVAIAIGGDAFVHAPSSTGVVRVERLSTRYWASRYLGARRPG